MFNEGSGNFGSCLADHLADLSNEVYIYCRSKETVDSFNNFNKNPKYLKDHIFPSNLKAIGPETPTTSFLSTLDVLLFAIPTQNMRTILISLKLDEVKPLPLLVFVNKGIETGTNKLPLEIIEEIYGSHIAQASVFISGPSFASEIIKRQPTQVSVSSHSNLNATKTAELFHQSYFRCYINSDPIGVELAGALKNIYAIAAGVATGLGYESNTRAGLITRSLSEMTKIGVVGYGSNPLTFLSLAGIGDLLLTCSSEKSRNFTVGFRLGKGEKLDFILESLGSIAEGVDTTKSAYDLIKNKGIDAPILEHVYKLLWENGEAIELASALLNLPMIDEKAGLE